MCQAMLEYDRGNYDRAFELLYPLRYKIVGIGGSDAQVRTSLPTVWAKTWSTATPARASEWVLAQGLATVVCRETSSVS